MNRHFLAIGAAILAIVSCDLPPAAAQMSQMQSAQSTIKIETPWARSTAGSAKTAAAYMTIVNTGSDADRLVSISTPMAGEAEPHSTTNVNGVMSMRPAGVIELKPGIPFVFSPGGYHVMLLDLKGPLVDGQTLPLTLKFEKAAAVTVMVPIRRAPPSGSAPAGAPMGGMGDMGSMKH
jgi:hypothetical protein